MTGMVSTCGKWRKSTFSNNGACVEVAPVTGGGVALRDSKDRGGAVLRFSAVEWAAFVAGVRADEFDL